MVLDRDKLKKLLKEKGVKSLDDLIFHERYQ
jgi:hypothetical protein